jgi:membrane AbrB-like protein
VAYSLRRFARFDATTAYFSASPGGLNEMVVVGGAMGGDERTISLVHAMRLLLTVLVVPFWFRLFQGYEPSAQGLIENMSWAIAPGDAIVLSLCAITGYWAAKHARVPAPALTGPLVFSALVHLGGLTAASPPGFLTALAQVVIGTSIGCRFEGIAVREMLGTMVTGALSTLFMLAMAVVLALTLEATAGLPFAALLLAFTPGGLAEMTLISLSLGIDAAFVSTHQVVRIFFIVALFPIAFRFLTGPPGQR